jgi:hypothetical protein
MRRLTSKQKNNVNDLLAAIKRQPTSPTSDKAIPELVTVKSQAAKERPKREAPKKIAPETKSKNRYGKPVQFWLHDDDRNLIREFYAWLAGQGVRPTDSLVIRGALRVAKTGSALLEACKEAAKLDGRLKQD